MSFLHPNAVLVTGIEQDAEEPEFDRVYIGPRYEWRYVLTDHGAVKLGPQHNYTVLPDDVPVYVDEEARYRARASDD